MVKYVRLNCHGRGDGRGQEGRVGRVTGGVKGGSPGKRVGYACTAQGTKSRSQKTTEGISRLESIGNVK